MNILRKQLLAAYRFIDSVQDAENLIEGSLMHHPEESYSLVVKVVYRKSGQDAAPLTMTKFMNVDTKGLLRDCRQIYSGNAYYGYIGSLVPLDLNGKGVKVMA